MLFNSLEFFVFLPVVFVLYWFVFQNNLRLQNVLLLVSSYFFYGWWDWRFLSLLILSSAFGFYAGIKINDAPTHLQRRRWMWFSVSVNIAVLCFFKYYNFFVDSWAQTTHFFHYNINPWTLKLILPLGISFYTFHGLSYLIDIYYERITPTRKFVDYGVFVSYFPLLVAGPIERATHLLPHIEKPRKFKYEQGVEGIRLMIWGLFKKVVIADSLAPSVNDIFAHYHDYSALTLIAGAIFFSIQMYADFSGYTDIARGVSKLFGLELLLNFNFPYFSKSIPEFWQRWHISLSSWLNDYVYTPLALQYRNAGKWGIYKAIFITFIISGFWHGAGWNFVVWGMLHALFYFPYVILSNKKIKRLSGAKVENPKIHFKEVPSILITFSCITFALIFFRSVGLVPAVIYVKNILVNIIRHPGQFMMLPKHYEAFIFVLLLMGFDLVAYTKEWKEKLQKHTLLTDLFYIGLIFTIISFLFSVDSNSFIYFQF